MTITQIRPSSTDTSAIASSLMQEAYEDARPFLQAAVELAFACFPNIRDVSLSRESDPETGEHWSELHLRIECSVDQAVESSAQFSDRWVAAVPWPDHHLILLSCDLI
jgi:hypothetical protein